MVVLLEVSAQLVAFDYLGAVSADQGVPFGGRLF